MAPIRITIADEHPIVRLGLTQALSPSHQIVGEAANAHDLLRCCDTTDTDMILLDYHLPGCAQYGDGLKLIGYIRRRFSRLKLVVFSTLRNAQTVQRLYDLGVAGVLPKQSSTEQLRHVVGTVSRGHTHREFCEPTPRVRTETPSQLGWTQLSSKEFEVLRLFVSGYRVSDIASLNHRSIKTVSAQKSNVMRKLAVNSDQELLLYCVESGFLR